MTSTELEALMTECEQTAGQSVLDHGNSVWRILNGMLADLLGLSAMNGIRWPEWVEEYCPEITNNLHLPKIMEQYARYHDCGKPFCRVVGEDGRVHFPDHATVSRTTYLEVFPGEETAANLIGWDMDFHTLNSSETAERLKTVWSPKDACTLLLTGLAEVHSNAQLFGGIESQSFKIKWKHLDRRGRQAMKLLFECP